MMNGLLIFASSCAGGKFFSFPTWYQYLDQVKGVSPCAPKISNINDVWLIVAAIIEILLRVAAIAAVAMVVYGGIIYTTSQGEPDKTGQAKNTIVNALVGLAVSISAAAIISFIAKQVP